ncbi:MAG: FtsQ-type POTRA domain-containing protein [Myxococcota bacterium]
MKIPRFAIRLGRRRTSGAPRGNRRRSGTGVHPRKGATPGDRAVGRRSAPVMRRARTAGSGRATAGWGRRALYLGLRLGIAGSVAWGVLVGVREGYAYATTSPRFEVRGLHYEPTAHVDDARLRELMALSPGTNILSLDLDAIAARVVASPWVARASVVRVLPDSLQVTVEEHEPRAVLLLGGRLWLVDGEGQPFKALEAGERGRLPVLTGFEQASWLGRPDAMRERVARGLAALAAYDGKRRPRLSELHIGEAGELTLYTARMGTQLRLGRGPVEPALARYDALRAALGEEAEKLALVHLDGERAPGRPDRIVASFFAAKQAPSLLAEAEARAEQRATQAAQRAQAQASKSHGKGTHKGKALNKIKGKGPHKGQLPRYQ